ncbi:MAG: transposase [Candidatus Brockarchaeota archaeon]|nr:transposase [Candidatus Brockarchaeota archaeon]MBO3808182.1 transposase [Candidatus Brockarchaeota archaeon]
MLLSSSSAAALSPLPTQAPVASASAPRLGARIRNGSLFKCQSCNYSCNADYNGAVNIMKQAIRHMRVAGAGLTQPITR